MKNKLLLRRMVAIVATFLMSHALVHAQAGKNYGIKIGGVELTSGNYQNITPAGGFPAVVGGTVKFDPESYTLSLSDVSIDGGSEQGIYFTSSGKTSQFELTGTNKVVSTGSVAVGTSVDLTIKGDGTLVASASGRSSYGILVSNIKSLTIEEKTTIEAEGKFYGIGANNNKEVLTIKDQAHVTARCSNNSCVAGFGSIVLGEGILVLRPVGAVVEGGAVKFNNQVCTGEVVIGSLTEEYGIRIGGVEVTSDNYLNITPEGGFPVVQSGTVKYSPRSRTLTLTDAIISAEDRNQRGIEIYGNGAYNLVLEGIKTNVSANSTALLATQLTISGKQGAFKSQTDCGIYIPNASFDESRYLTIDGCVVTASGVWGIAGRDGSSEILTVKNATVKAQGESGSICDLKELELIGCVIAGPKSAVWDPEKHAICNPLGDVITSQVIIEPMGTAIGDIQTDKNATMEQGTYTMSGQRIKGDRNNLPRGIYIMKGKKVVIN